MADEELNTFEDTDPDLELLPDDDVSLEGIDTSPVPELLDAALAAAEEETKEHFKEAHSA